jgi:glyoxylase-like metal-dependent hydrolase (beta-lactamase superfamily II)
MLERTDGATPAVTPEALAERIAAGDDLTVLDVRDRDEFEAWRVDGPGVEAVQIPHVKFVGADATGGVADLVADLTEPIVAVCGEGDASAFVADLLDGHGFDVANLTGGMDAWAQVYTEAPVAGDAATVVQYRRPASGCLASLVSDGEHAAVVDPLRAFADRYVADCEARGWDLVAAVDTHVHADHVSGVRAVADRTGADIVVPVGARERGLDYDRDVRFVDHGDSLAVGDLDLEALRLPGHTTEMTGYRVGDLLLSGDSLFLDGVARPDLEGAAGDTDDDADGERARDLAATLYHTLQERVLDLPDETRLCPSHCAPGTPVRADDTYTATVGELRERVPALSLSQAEFVDRIAGATGPRPANFQRIVATNLGQADADDETAFELELGPNNCAATGD